MTSIPCARLVTYVVATFNEESNILAFLDSIPANIAQNSIFHFQDCQSCDSTFRLIESAAKSYSHLDIRLYSEIDTGIYDAWNKAIARCTTPWIGFVGADDRFVSPGYDLSLYPDLDSFNFITFCGYYGMSFYGRALPSSMKLGAFKKGWNIMHQGSLYRADIVKETHFRTDFKICGDFHHLLAVRSLVAYRHIPLRLLHVGTQGISSRKTWLVAIESFRSFASIEDSGPIKFLFALFIFFYTLAYSILRP